MSRLYAVNWFCTGKAKNIFFRELELVAVIFFIFLLQYPLLGVAKEVTLVWDPNTERNLGGYRIYHGTLSRSYTSVVDVGNQTTYTISNLVEGWTYYFAVTAYNARQTFESTFSNEVSTADSAGLKAQLESPSEGSYESGIGLIRGWACKATTIEVEIDGGQRLKAAYGTPRSDTQAICGSTDTGYGLTYNWSVLGDGFHTLRVLADGVEFSRVRFYVTTFGQPFMQGLSGDFLLDNFPEAGDRVAIRWSEPQQNFVIVGAGVNSGSNREILSNKPNSNASLAASQESPTISSFESGIGLIRGWVCNASTVEVQIDGGERLRAGYGTPRPDVAVTCGHPNVGYGLVFNWNTLGDGSHNLKAFADGVEFADVVFTVTTLGQDFLRNAPPREQALVNFPSTGRNTIIRWSEAHQNFVIAGVQ